MADDQIDTLNSLLKTTIDSVNGYRNSAEDLDSERLRQAFQQNATELAYLRDKIVRQVIGPDALETEKQLLDELRVRRPSVPFPPMPAFAQAAPRGASRMAFASPMVSGSSAASN